MTKERNMATFKVGDRVRLTADGLAHWGDQASGTTGTITPESDEDGWVYVEWGNGRTECYRPSVDITLADAPPPPATVEPPRPSDAEVCAAWETRMSYYEDEGLHAAARACDGVNVGGVDGPFFSRAAVMAARSRELRRLAAASAETERLRVVVQCQDGGADDV